MSKGRHVPPLTPAQIHSSNVDTHIPTSMRDWDAAEQRRTLDNHTIAVAIEQNRKTGLFHTWLSLYGTDITSWGVYRDEQPAQALAGEIRDLFSLELH